MSRLLSSIFLIISLGVFLTPASTDALRLWSPKDPDAPKPTEAFTNAAGFETGAEVTAENIVGTIINAFLGLLGVIFIMLIIYGGFIWMNAQGNEEDVKKAKSIITQATMGLIVVLGAYALSRFVISALTEKTLVK